jgi:hypothetical protein
MIYQEGQYLDYAAGENSYHYRNTSLELLIRGLNQGFNSHISLYCMGYLVLGMCLSTQAAN